MKRFFILGAPDPEMAAIESLLRSVPDCEIGHAVGPDGERVHPGNAYRAIGFRLASGGNLFTRWHGVSFVIECGGDLPPDAGWIDHHRPGDPGYGRPPMEFFEASSLGQVIKILEDAGALFLRQGRKADDHDEGCPSAYVLESSDYILTTIDAALVAAADHCLEAAYRGRCPGVDPDALMRWRIESRAVHQGRSAASIMADVNAAREILRVHVFAGHMCPNCGERGSYCGCGFGGAMGEERIREYADLRGRHIPELPEAAAREGIPFLATVKDRDGREKIVIQAAGPDLVSRFIAGEIIHGLVDVYGDPARGFAGGYLDICGACGGTGSILMEGLWIECPDCHGRNSSGSVTN